jgi:CMP-N-acetylneuraminic acid synthetase
MMGEKTIPYLLSENEVQDIDNIEDWRLAELKMKLIQDIDQ